MFQRANNLMLHNSMHYWNKILIAGLLGADNESNKEQEMKWNGGGGVSEDNLVSISKEALPIRSE